MKKKTTKLLLISLTILFIGSVLLVLVSSLIFSPQYVIRTIVNGNSDVMDYKVFPERIIQKSAQPYYYKYGLDRSLKTMPIDYIFSGKSRKKPLDTFLKKTNTTSFIIVHDDKVVFEEYYNGYDKDTVNTSFSMAKSIDSLLIGMAIGYGACHRPHFVEFIDIIRSVTEFSSRKPIPLGVGMNGMLLGL